MANLLIQRNITQLVDAVELALADSANTYLTAAEAKEAVRRAIYDMSMHVPRQRVYELTLNVDVDNEDFTSSHGVAVSLANKPIEYNSETVATTNGATSYVRDTDYTMDYMNGTITTLAAGTMVTATGYHISYTKSRIIIDLTSIITDLIRVVRVENPLNNVPQSFWSFDVWGNYLIMVSPPSGSQEKMRDTEHVVIYYEAEHQIADA